MDSDFGTMTDPFELFAREQPSEAVRVQKLVDEGRAFLENGESEKARIAFMKALAIFPLIPPALTNLAALALQRQQPEQAWHYLSELWEHYPYEPASHGVAIRYWLAKGSRPLAYRHGLKALRGLRALIDKERTGPLFDPSSIGRAVTILLSAFSSFEADALLVQLYETCGEREWDRNALLTFGIAHYNLGDFTRAECLWRRAKGAESADLYLYLLQLIEREVVPAFRLDYHLGARMPSLEELQQALQAGGEVLGRHATGTVAGPYAPSEAEGGFDVGIGMAHALREAVALGVPSLTAIDAVRHVLEGSDEEAELAYSILFFDRWPFLAGLLHYVVGRSDLSTRVRLNAVLYMLWTDGYEVAKSALETVRSEARTDLEQLLVNIVGLQIALVIQDVVEGRSQERQARTCAEKVGEEGKAWLAVLEELSTRLGRLEAELSEHGASGTEGVDAVRAGDGRLPSNVIVFPGRRSREADRPSEER